MIVKLDAIESSTVLAKSSENGIEIFMLDGKSTGINLVKLSTINIEALLQIQQVEQSMIKIK